MEGGLHPRISVLIPAYNAEATIGATLKSVLVQTVAPQEIFVMDDGSADNTAEIVGSFLPRVTLFQQNNKGVSAARNTLLKKASGDLVSLLDHDDLWHPRYLEVQCQMYRCYPDAAVYYTAFENITEHQQCTPEKDLHFNDEQHVLQEPSEFLNKYNKASGYNKPSFSLIRAEALRELGEYPLPEDLKGSDDVYLWYRLALIGPFVKSHARLGAYRLVETSLSSDRIIVYKERVKAVEKVWEVYQHNAPEGMQKIARDFLATSYRRYATYLAGGGSMSEARRWIRKSLRLSFGVKSLGVLLVTYLPRRLQLTWPQRWR